MDSATDWLIDNNAYTEELFNENIKNIIHITDAELAKTRAAVAAVVPPGTDALDIELRTLELQLFKARTDHQEQIGIANLYYGHDPLTHKGENPAYKGFEEPPGRRRAGQRGYYRAVEKWNISYAAAYEAKFLAEQIKLLDARLAAQNNIIAEANAKAAAAAQARALAEAKRVAEEQARNAAEAEARRVAEERARLARIAATVAAEQAHKEAEALREVERWAWIAAEDAAETRRQAEVQKARKPALATRTFPVSGSTAAAGPVFTIAGGTLAPNRGTSLAITATLRVAVSAITETIAATAIPAVAGVAALIYPSELGNGERYALSVPLSELAPANPDDLLAVAASGGEINLPVVLGSMTTDDEMEFVVASTDGMLVPSSVPIQLATLDPHSNVYRSYSPNASSIGMTWTPIVKPGDASTALPASVPNIVLYNGGSPWGQTPWIDTHPELELYDFGGGFVTVFPIESGIPPIYTVFNNPYEGATTKGEHSGRDFNPEQAGGPVLELDWSTATVTQEGIDAVKLHIARLDQSDANDVMIERLEKILKGELAATDVDKRFYTHEIRELERFRNIGYSDTYIPQRNSPLWNNAHTASLEDYKVYDHESFLYTTEAIVKADIQDERDYQQLLKEMPK
ncbi:S-type pyocin domain-containing protein [Pseudomonas lini]|uniref:Pyosin/cloacin translocation domain-containing protein n=1 Tax=Pseudomonas lini TaxID=163011 RepID=A0A423ISQ2_9PSED|nr:S-type pyocin domain-containing protein [Pseudomonas lini]RON28502.1 hypothetical protein BK663_07365 [Pseudomonas lini]